MLAPSIQTVRTVTSRFKPRPPFDPENATIREFVHRVAELIPAGARLLDAGAGDSPYRKIFDHTNYIAVDMAATGYHQFGSIAVRGSLDALPFSSDAFDAVVCTQVLEHVPDPGRVLSELGRVLKAGGKLFLTVPQSWEVHEAPYDYFRFTRYGLEVLFATADLEVISIRPRGGYFYLLAARVRDFPRYLDEGLWRLPVSRRVLRVLFQRLLVRLLASLDHLDTEQRETLGYECVATKPVQRA
jgi:SAM-dependent methyltransferase